MEILQDDLILQLKQSFMQTLVCMFCCCCLQVGHEHENILFINDPAVIGVMEFFVDGIDGHTTKNIFENFIGQNLSWSFWKIRMQRPLKNFENFATFIFAVFRFDPRSRAN